MFPQTSYVCQTYKEVSLKGGKTLAMDKQFSFKTAEAAEDRARRAFERGQCVGADAFKISFDLESEEYSDPEFLVRLGKVPSLEE